MKFHTTISVPNVRAEQLRIIADEQGITVATLIEKFAREMWQVFGHGHNLPLLPVYHRVSGKRAFVEFKGFEKPIRFLPDQASAISEGIKALVSGDFPRFKTEFGSSKTPSFMTVERKGRGFILRGERADVELGYVGLTASIAADLAKSFFDEARKAVAAEIKANSKS